MSYRYAELVAQKVAEAPPLTDEQISRLTVLFSVSVEDRSSGERSRMAA